MRCYLDLFGGKVFGSPEHITLGKALTPQLMDLDHLPVGDETNESIGRQQTEGHLQGFLE